MKLFGLFLGPDAEPGTALRVPTGKKKRSFKKKLCYGIVRKAAKYEVLPQGQLGHIQVPQGTLESGDCDRGAN